MVRVVFRVMEYGYCGFWDGRAGLVLLGRLW